MTRLLESLMLMLTVTIVPGCGLSNSLGDDPAGATQEMEFQIAASAEPLPVSAQELAAIDTLRQRGAEIDCDDAQHVRIVELVNTKVTDDDLKLLSEFPCLESLDITGGAITEAGLVNLKGLKDLQRLYLNDLTITNDALANLSDLTKLDVLSLRNTKIDGKGIAHLKQLTQLTVLNLSKTAITNESLKQIQGMTALDTLVLADTAATGAGFAYLQPLKELRTLNVDRCKSLEGHLLKLGGLRQLRMLYVNGCTISDVERGELEDRNGRLAIFGL